MRLHVPDHLQKAFRALMNVSFDLKKRNPDLKRSVKFSDDDMSLYMDVQLQRDGEWRRIEQDHAIKITADRPRKGNAPGAIGERELATLLEEREEDQE